SHVPASSSPVTYASRAVARASGDPSSDAAAEDGAGEGGVVEAAEVGGGGGVAAVADDATGDCCDTGGPDRWQAASAAVRARKRAGSRSTRSSIRPRPALLLRLFIDDAHQGAHDHMSHVSIVKSDRRPMPCRRCGRLISGML